MFESDGWLDWDPDPERAAQDADPKLEPFASMSKAELLDRMMAAKGGREWEFLQQYFLNACALDEIAVGMEAFIKAQYPAIGDQELCFLEPAIDLALRRHLAIAEARALRSAPPQAVDPHSDDLDPLHLPVGEKAG